MFTFTDNEILTNEKCFDNLYDLYNYRTFKNKLVFCLENKIIYKLPLKMISVKWAVACAEKDLYIFEKHTPFDNRPRLAIEAAKQWIIDQTNSDYSDDAAYASSVIDGAAYCTAPPVAAAAYFAYAAVTYANTDFDFVVAYAHAADSWACDAISSAIYAANADAYADVVTAYSDYQNWSRNKLKEIVEEYLNNYRHLLKNTLKHLIIPELSDIIIKYVF